MASISFIRRIWDSIIAGGDGASIPIHSIIWNPPIFISGATFTQYNNRVAGWYVNGNNDIFYPSIEIRSGWDGANQTLEVDWFPTTDIANGETVIFNVTYVVKTDGQDVDSGTVASGVMTYTSVGVTSAGTMIHTPLTIAYNDANQPLVADAHIYFRFYRDFTGDTFSGVTCINAFEHIQYISNFSQG